MEIWQKDLELRPNPLVNGLEYECSLKIYFATVVAVVVGKVVVGVTA